MSFVITEIGVRRWAKVSKPSTHEKGSIPVGGEKVLRFEDAEIIQYPNIPNEWEQRKRDEPLLDIPWNTDWLV